MDELDDRFWRHSLQEGSALVYFLSIRLQPKSWNLSHFCPDASLTDTVLRLSLWWSSSLRLSEDLSVSLSRDEQLVAFNLSRYYCHEPPGEVFLYLDLFHTRTGAPLAIGSVRIALSPVPSSSALSSCLEGFNAAETTRESPATSANKREIVVLDAFSEAVLVTTQLRPNAQISNLKEIYGAAATPLRVDMQLALQTSLSRVKEREIDRILRRKTFSPSRSLSLLRPCPQRVLDVEQGLYSPADRLHLMVEDLQLNKDLLDFYQHRPIAVRVYGVSNASLSSAPSHSAQKKIYLGSVHGMNATWVESVELTSLTPCEAVEIEVVALAAQRKESERSNLIIEEILICRGCITAKHFLSSSDSSVPSSSASSSSSSSQSLSALRQSSLSRLKQSEMNSAIGTALSNGEYETMLFTEISPSPSAVSLSSDAVERDRERRKRVQVGQIRMSLQRDDLDAAESNNNNSNSNTNTTSSQRQSVDIKKFKVFLENESEKVCDEETLSRIFTLLSSCCQAIDQSLQDAATTSSQEIERQQLQWVHFLDLSLAKLCLSEYAVDDLVDFLAMQTVRESERERAQRERSSNKRIRESASYTLHRSVLVGLHFYFQEWLASDFVQDLLSLSSSTATESPPPPLSPFLTLSEFMREEEKHQRSLQRALLCVVWSRRIISRLSSEQLLSLSLSLGEEDYLSLPFVTEIMEDLFPIVCMHRTRLLRSLVQLFHRDTHSSMSMSANNTHITRGGETQEYSLAEEEIYFAQAVAEREQLCAVIEWMDRSLSLSLSILRLFEAINPLLVQRFVEVQYYACDALEMLIERENALTVSEIEAEKSLSSERKPNNERENSQQSERDEEERPEDDRESSSSQTNILRERETRREQRRERLSRMRDTALHSISLFTVRHCHELKHVVYKIEQQRETLSHTQSTLLTLPPALEMALSLVPCVQRNLRVFDKLHAHIAERLQERESVHRKEPEALRERESENEKGKLRYGGALSAMSLSLVSAVRAVMVSLTQIYGQHFTSPLRLNRSSLSHDQEDEVEENERSYNESARERVSSSAAIIASLASSCRMNALFSPQPLVNSSSRNDTVRESDKERERDVPMHVADLQPRHTPRRRFFSEDVSSPQQRTTPTQNTMMENTPPALISHSLSLSRSRSLSFSPSPLPPGRPRREISLSPLPPPPPAPRTRAHTQSSQVSFFPEDEDEEKEISAAVSPSLSVAAIGKSSATLLLLQQTAPLLSLLYEITLFILGEADRFPALVQRRVRVRSAEDEGCFEAIHLLQELLSCLVTNIAQSEPWDLALVKRVFWIFLFSADSIAFNEEIREGIEVFATFACNADRLYLALMQRRISQSFLNVVTNEKSSKGQNLANKDIPQSYSISKIDAARLLFRLNVFSAVLYDTRKISESVLSSSSRPVALNLSLSSSSFTRPAAEAARDCVTLRCLSLSTERSLPLESVKSFGFSHVRVDVLLALQRAFVVHWQAMQYDSDALFREYSRCCERNIPMSSSKSLYSVVNTLRKAMREGGIDTSMTAEDAVRASQRALCASLHKHLSSLEITLATLRTAVGVQALLRGEIHAHNGRSALSHTADELFSLSFLSRALHVVLEVFRCAYSSPTSTEYRRRAEAMEKMLFSWEEEEEEEEEEERGAHTPSQREEEYERSEDREICAGAVAYASRIARLRKDIVSLLMEIVLLRQVDSTTFSLSPSISHKSDDWRERRCAHLWEELQSFVLTQTTALLSEKQWCSPALMLHAYPSHAHTDTNMKNDTLFTVNMDAALVDLLHVLSLIHSANTKTCPPTHNEKDRLTAMFLAFTSSLQSLNIYAQLHTTPPQKPKPTQVKNKDKEKEREKDNGFERFLSHCALSVLSLSTMQALSVRKKTDRSLESTQEASSGYLVLYQELKNTIEDSCKIASLSAFESASPTDSQRENTMNVSAVSAMSTEEHSLEKVRDEDYWRKYVGLSHAAFSALSLFLLEFQQNRCASVSTSASMAVSERQREREVQLLRDALSQLMQSGFWEIGLRVTQWYRKQHNALSLAAASQQRTWSPISSSKAPLSASLSSWGALSPHMKKTKTHRGVPPGRSTLAVSSSSSSFFFSSSSLIPPPPPSLPPASPSVLLRSPQRVETISRELARLESKFEEKLKFDGAVRLPTRYFALRLASSAPLLFSGEGVSAKMLNEGPLSVLGVHVVNYTNTAHLVRPLQGGEGEASETQQDMSHSSASATTWYEQWFVLRFDCSAALAVADFYALYVEELQQLLKAQGSAAEEDVQDLSSPLAFHTISQQICKAFPDFELIDANQDLDKLPDYSALFKERFASIFAEKAGSGAKKYVQIFSAFDADIFGAAVREKGKFLTPSPRRADDNEFNDSEDNDDHEHENDNDNDSSNDSENDEDETSRKADLAAVATPITILSSASNNESERATRRVKRDLDMQFLDFARFPSSFVVFSAQSSCGEEDREIIKVHLSIDSTCLEVRETLTSAEPEIDCEEDESEKMEINAVAMTPIALAQHLQSERVSLTQSCLEVLLSYSVSLDRALRSLKHLNDLKATELQNQPDHSILHSDCLFFHCVDLLSTMLAQPSTVCVGIHNVDFILLAEKEKIEVKWQTSRKHAKREYMRLVAQYDEEVQKKSQLTVRSSSDHVLGSSYVRKTTSGAPVALKKPEEPDWQALKEAFDKEAGLELLMELQIMRNHVFDRIYKVIREMNAFVNKISSISQATSTRIASDDVQESTRKKGRPSVTAMTNLRLAQWAQQISQVDTEENDDNQQPLDDEVSLKRKLCMYLEALAAGIELGAAL